MSFPDEDELTNWLQARHLGFEPKVSIGPSHATYFVVPRVEYWDVFIDGPHQHCYHEFDWSQTGQWKCRLCGMAIVTLYYAPSAS